MIFNNIFSLHWPFLFSGQQPLVPVLRLWIASEELWCRPCPASCFLSASILTIVCIVWIFMPCPPCCLSRVRWVFFSFTWMILLMTAWLTRSSSLEIFLKSIIFNSIVKQKTPLYGGFKCLPRALAAQVGAQLVVHLNSWCQHIRSGICCFQS